MEEGATAGVERALQRRLAVWTAASSASALALEGASRQAVRPGQAEVLRAAARQTAGWAAVDAAILAWGRLRRAAPRPPAEARRRLQRLLAVNAALDVGYVAGGAAAVVAGRRPGGRARLVGDGAAVVVQGAALLALDAAALRELARVPE